jgi:hypothetical protein
MTQFRNRDIAGPQRLRIKWERETPRDDHTNGPEGDGDGFWPSNDPDDAGYVLPENFDDQQAKAQARADAYYNDEWEWIGVVAVANVSIPIGGGAYALHTIKSPGVWGIESDSGDYLDEVYAEQKAELLDQLRTLGTALIAGDFSEMEDS